MCMNDLLREETFHFQFDEQFALENGKDSEAMTVVEEIIQDGDRLECVVRAGLADLPPVVVPRLMLVREPFSMGGVERNPAAMG